MYGLKTESSFDAAHFLTDYHGKCENLHGHRWRVVAYLEQEDLQSEGTMKDMVLDFGEFKQAVRAMTEAARSHLHRGGRFALAADDRVFGGRRLHTLRHAVSHHCRESCALLLRSPARTGLAHRTDRRVRDPEQLRDLPRLAGKESADRYDIRFFSYSRALREHQWAKARTRASSRRSFVFRAVTWIVPIATRSGRVTRSSPLNS